MLRFSSWFGFFVSTACKADVIIQGIYQAMIIVMLDWSAWDVNYSQGQASTTAREIVFASADRTQASMDGSTTFGNAYSLAERTNRSISEDLKAHKKALTQISEDRV